MRFNLVDQHDNIVNTVELASNVGVTGARAYFIGLKGLDEKEFDKLWKVMTEDEWNRQFELGHRKAASYQWWKDEDGYLDIDR